MSLNIFRRRGPPSYVVIVVFLVLLVLAGINGSNQSTNVRLLRLARARLKSLQNSYDAERDRRDWDIHVGDVDLHHYTQELSTAWSKIFLSPAQSSWFSFYKSQPHPAPFSSILSHLALDNIPEFESRIPHRVYTTSNVRPEKYPPQFRYWAQNDHSLSFRHLNDTLMDKYLTTIFPPLSPMSKLLASVPKTILKADILRYTLMFHKGGIYTDIDTAAVRPFDEWGTTGTLDLSDHVLGSLPLFLSGDIKLADKQVPPSLIVAIEIGGGDGEWKEKTMARGLQIVQWTLAAQPGHPIFLDVLNRSIGKWQEAVKSKADLSQVDPLQWTGPGPFTDAVLRYILARHGVHPRRLVGLSVPARIGDVLILPHRAFQADASEGKQPEQACVWHGFFGSWKEEDAK